MNLKSIKKSFIAFLMIAAMVFSIPVEAEAATAGIDVSKYQGAINWGAVAQSGVTFSFIKVGSTNSGLDPYFAHNVAAAQAAGIRTGVYIYSYATSVAQAQAEAQLVLKWIEGFNINYPVAFDIEDATQKRLDPNTCTAMCNAFGDIIAAAGYTPIIYTYTNFYKAHMTSALKYPKWIAQYADACAIPGYTIWQCTSSGSVAGISGRVDMNIDVLDWRNFIVAAGPCNIGGNIYVFNNYRKQFGWANVAGTKYLTDPTTGIAFTNQWYGDAASGLYYLNNVGAAVVGLQSIGDGIYFFNADATMHTGWKELGGNTFLFSPTNGKLHTGWYKDASGMYYMDPKDGHRVSGAAAVDDSVYYFAADGKMQTGLITINGSKFYFGADGKMQTGFQNVNGKVCYFGSNGAMATGAVAVDNDVYYFGADGGLQTGLITINGKKYYFAADGKMQKGFVTVGKTVYYFGADGTMATGIFQDTNGTFYAAGQDGHICINETVTAGGNTFVFGGDGKLVKGQLYTIGKTVYACDENGIVTATATK